MNALRQLRNSSIFCVATIALAFSSNAYAQTSYKVADQGTLGDDNFGMVMGLNNQGWTQNMDGEGNPPVLSLSTTVLSGRAVMNIDGHNIDLGTLGGKNSWTNYGGINDRGENVGMSETSVPDPDGEDFCAFGTKLTCRGFLWRHGQMTALPTLGGNNARRHLRNGGPGLQLPAGQDCKDDSAGVMGKWRSPGSSYAARRTRWLRTRHQR